uniref:Putative ovule protein n=1 Tax=Solanum chacoense TaxID=4108 RepID=A0A0V0HS49_SOLCH
MFLPEIPHVVVIITIIMMKNMSNLIVLWKWTKVDIATKMEKMHELSLERDNIEADRELKLDGFIFKLIIIDQRLLTFLVLIIIAIYASSGKYCVIETIKLKHMVHLSCMYIPILQVKIDKFN